MKQFILAVICLVGFISCEKNRTTFSGDVINPLTGETYEGIEFKMYQQYLTFVRDYGIVRSDAIGHFHFSKIPRGKNTIEPQLVTDLGSLGLYGLGFVQSDGSLSNFGQSVFLSVGEDNVSDYYIVRNAHIQLNFENINCFDQNDEAKLIGIYSLAPFHERPMLSERVIGCDWETIIPVLPEGSFYLSFEVTKNNVTTISYDTIQVVAGDTLFYQLQY